MATIDGEIGEPICEGKRPRRWRSRLAWPVLLMLGLLIYELTAQPGPGAAVACAKFGWNDFLTARWLWRIDPNRRRARACAILCIASGFWKIALTGTLLVLVLTLTAGAKPGGPPEALVGALLAAAIGFGISALTTCVAFGLAWKNGIRLWLSNGLHAARREGVWPSLHPAPYQRNMAGAIIMTALAMLYLFVVMPAIMVGFGFLAAAIKQDVVTAMLFFLAFLGGGPVLSLKFRDVLHRRLLAAAPVDCWGIWDADEWLRRTQPREVADENDSGGAFPGDG